MVELTFTDSDTLDLSVDADGNLTGEVKTDAVCAQLVQGPNLAKLKAAIDTRLQSLNWDGNQLGATISDGTVIAPVDVNINLTAGVYTPDASGNVTIPLTDGAGNVVISGVVSDPDVDFADTTYVVNTDGSATLSYLDADGNQITTTAFPAPADDVSLTQPTVAADGCTVTLPMSSGVSYSLSLCDLVSDIQDNGDGTFTYTPAGGGTPVTWGGSTAPVNDVTTTTAAANPLTRGLSAGQVNKPVGSAATLADVNGADPALEVSYQSMQQVFTNRAAEAGGGMMNGNGSLGHHCAPAPYPLVNNTIDVSTTNGGWARLGGLAPGDVATLSAPRYSGQLLYMGFPTTGALGTFGEITVLPEAGTRIDGVYRDQDHSIRRHGGTRQGGMVIRAHEIYILRGANTSTWQVVSKNLFMFSGPGWHENYNGTVSMDFRSFIPPQASGIVDDAPLPVQIVNPEDMIVNITDFYDGTPDVTVGQNVSGLADIANWNFTHVADVSTTTAVGFVSRYSGNDGPPNLGPAGVNIQIEGAILDYPAL